MNPILTINSLRKNYLLKPALTNVTMDLQPGRILGLMGPNGSGKTTLLKILSGLLQPSGGTFSIDGSSNTRDIKAAVSFLADRNTLYAWMKAEDAILYYADFFQDFDKAKAYEMLTFMKLEKGQRVKTMSKGMLEKLHLVLAFSRNAKVFLMDEPLAGVDPVAREKIVSTIIKTWSENSSIIISTHLVTDIEPILNDIAFLHKGEIILSGDAEDLRVSRGKSIHQIYLDVFAESF